MGTYEHSFFVQLLYPPLAAAVVVVAVVDGGKRGKEIVVWPSGKGNHQFHRRILRSSTDRDFPPIFAAEKK